VDEGLEHIEPSNRHGLSLIMSHSSVYLQMSVITAHIDEASHWLLKPTGSVTLGERAPPLELMESLISISHQLEQVKGPPSACSFSP
jgi:hypothetical protein